jgi:hypothetical protein
MKCLICLDDIDNTEFLPCSHGFHTNCISEWINVKPFCPICKIPISITTPDELIIYNNERNIFDNNNIRKNQLYHRINEITGITPVNLNESSNSEPRETIHSINIELQNILNFEHTFNNKYYNTITYNGINNLNNLYTSGINNRRNSNTLNFMNRDLMTQIYDEISSWGIRRPEPVISNDILREQPNSNSENNIYTESNNNEDDDMENVNVIEFIEFIRNSTNIISSVVRIVNDSEINESEINDSEINDSEINESENN